jgi:hypothetical protein
MAYIDRKPTWLRPIRVSIDALRCSAAPSSGIDDLCQEALSAGRRLVLMGFYRPETTAFFKQGALELSSSEVVFLRMPLWWRSPVESWPSASWSVEARADQHERGLIRGTSQKTVLSCSNTEGRFDLAVHPGNAAIVESVLRG